MLPGYFVKDSDGGIAQDPAWIAAVEQRAADPAVDDFLELDVQGPDAFGLQR